MAGVVELVDRAVALPPGPELSAVLDALPRERIPNARLVEVAQARSRQLAHEQAELFADMVEIAHAVAVADVAGDQAEAVALDPRTGTATLAGNGLPPDEAAAAAQRIDRLVAATKRAGHPGTRAQISADLYLGMLDGAFHGLTEKEIIDRLLAVRRPEDGRDIEPVVPDTSTEITAEDADRWPREHVAAREGIEIRVGLATLAGLDDRPAEIPGLGPVGAHLARTAVATQRRGASWKFAIVDTSGYLLLAGPLRRRPPGSGQVPPVRGGVVELHLTLDELRRYGADPVLGEWDGVLAEIAEAWAHRDEFRRRLAANPRARFARGPLADHIRIRDRHCCGPGCTRSARRSDLAHTREHACGGDTVEMNIGRPANVTTRTRSAGGRWPNPSPGCSGGSALRDASTGPGASRSAPISPTRTRHRTRTRKPPPRSTSGFVATTRGSWTDPPRISRARHRRDPSPQRPRSPRSDGRPRGPPAHPIMARLGPGRT